MRVGIDAQAAHGTSTGLGVYTRNLIERLLAHPQNGFEIKLFQTTQKRDWNTFRRLWWENQELPRRAQREGVQILHTPAFAPPFWKPCKVVVTVHDLIGMRFPNQLGWPSRFYWGKWLPRAVKRADLLIADSENTKKDLWECLRIPESRISVIHPSGHEGFSPRRDPQAFEKLCRRLGIKKQYFLAVGTLEPRKNIQRVIEAFVRFSGKRKGKDAFELVVVGLTDFAHGRFVRTVLKNSPSSVGVLLTGYLEQEKLNLLYSGAVGFVFPSLYEGFGIPVLEAMGSGTPVLTARTSSLPEVAGEAAIYVDPGNTQAIAEGMESLAEDSHLREELIQKGFVQKERFSWQKTAQETLKAYEALT